MKRKIIIFFTSLITTLSFTSTTINIYASLDDMGIQTYGIGGEGILPPHTGPEEPGGSFIYGIEISVISTDGDSSSSLILGSILNSGNGGHSFIVIRNICIAKTIVVGQMPIMPNEMITIGSWGNQESLGIWYNLESFFMNVSSRYIENLSLKENYTFNTFNELINFLDPLNNYINNVNTWSLLNNNCSTFAQNCWNILSAKTISAGGIIINTPHQLYNSIKTYYGHLTNQSVYYNTKVGYYDNNGLFNQFDPSTISGNGLIVEKLEVI